MIDSQNLLANYAATRSEEAFRQLVERYLNLVYSTALRLVNGDVHRAEDVAQIVFSDLARLARGLPAGVMIGGWLHRRTWHVAATLMRGERRRRKREWQAMQMKALDTKQEPRFEELAPVLDEAINHLTRADQTAIVLRFFEQRDLRSVGAALRTNEDAAQKRVARALEKLRLLLVRRGVVLSGAGLAAVLSSQAVTAAPASLGASISAAALASAAAGSGGFTISLLHLMNMAKLKIAIGTVVAAGVGATLVVETRTQARLRDENRALQEQVQQLARQAETPANPAGNANSSEALSESQFRELLRLRGEVGRLREQAAEMEKLRAENQQWRAKASANTLAQPQREYVPKDSLAFAGYGDPDSAVQSMLWAGSTLNGETILESFSPDQQKQWLKIHKTPEGVATQIARCFVGANMTNVQGYRIMNKKAGADDEVFYSVYVEGLDVLFKQRMKRVGSEWKFDGEVPMEFIPRPRAPAN